MATKELLRLFGKGGLSKAAPKGTDGNTGIEPFTCGGCLGRADGAELCQFKANSISNRNLFILSPSPLCVIALKQNIPALALSASGFIISLSLAAFPQARMAQAEEEEEARSLSSSSCTRVWNTHRGVGRG